MSQGARPPWPPQGGQGQAPYQEGYPQQGPGYPPGQQGYPQQGGQPYQQVVPGYPPGYQQQGAPGYPPGRQPVPRTVPSYPPPGAPYAAVPFNFRALPASSRKAFIDFAVGLRQDAQQNLLTPEGLNLHFLIAPLGERFFALLVDYTIIFALNFLLVVFPEMLLGQMTKFTWTVAMFFAFVVNNIYFIFFELRWQGRTPGKKVNRLWVINRAGGELSPFAVVSRNITRQLEILFPLTLFMGLYGDSFISDIVFPVFWLIAITLLPLWNKAHLRAGDILGGTIVISIPDEELLPDLTFGGDAATHRAFTKDQLSIYGSYELHILEEILRKAEKGVTAASLAKVAGRISARVGYPLPPEGLDYKGYKQFLTDFYASLRAFLEEAKLYGRHKANQYSPMVSSQPAFNPHSQKPGY